MLLLAGAAIVGGSGRPSTRLGPWEARAGPPGALRELHPRQRLYQVLAGVWQRMRPSTWVGQETSLAGDIELYAACLSAGLSPAVASGVVAEAVAVEVGAHARQQLWQPIAGLQLLGVEARRAWEGATGVPGVEELGTLETLSHAAGTHVADGAHRIAGELRAQAADRLTRAAAQAGVLIAMPLSLCFLPAFVLLGLVPVIAGLVLDIFPTQ